MHFYMETLHAKNKDIILTVSWVNLLLRLFSLVKLSQHKFRYNSLRDQIRDKLLVWLAWVMLLLRLDSLEWTMSNMPSK